MGTKRALITAQAHRAIAGIQPEAAAVAANLSHVRTPVEGLALALLAIEERAEQEVACVPLLAVAHLEGKALVEAPGVGYTTVYGVRFEEIVNELLDKPFAFESPEGHYHAIFEAVSQAMSSENHGILPQQAPAKIPVPPKRRGRPPKDPNAPPKAKAPAISKKLEFAPQPRPKRIRTVVARVFTAIQFGCARLTAAAKEPEKDSDLIAGFRKNLDLVDRLGTPGAWRATREMAIALHVWDRAGTVLRGNTMPLVLDYYAEERRIVEAAEMGCFAGTTRSLAEAIDQALKAAGSI